MLKKEIKLGKYVYLYKIIRLNNVKMAAKRGRPLGSTNRKQESPNVVNVSLEKQIEGAPITKYNAQYNIINYGERNDYPFKLINLYNTSVSHRACIDFATNAIVGDGVDWDAMKIKNGDVPNPNYYTSWNDFIRGLAFDYCLYSAFSFQVIKNKDNKTYSFFNQPIESVRLEEMDEEGVINNAYLCKDWTATGQYPPVKMPMFGFQEGEEIPIGVPHLFYHKKYNPVNAYYGLPIYSSALNAIQTESKFQEYDLKSVVNGFTPIGAITLPAVETDAERNAIIKNITQMFTGEQNANSLVVTFRNNIEDKPIEYTPFTQTTTNVNLYADSNERTINRIMAAHRINSKSLVGFPVDNTGFSDSGNYMEEAFRLYNINVANNNRREILDVINTCFKANGVDVEIILRPLRYRTDEDGANVNTNDNSNGKPQTEEQVTERENNTL